MSLKISTMLVRQLCFTLHAIPASVLLKEVIFSHWLKVGVINLEYHTAVYSVYRVFAAKIAKKRFIKYL